MKISFLAPAAILTAPVPALAAGKLTSVEMPDFTKGETIPKGAMHDWNLGPTVLRGWAVFKPTHSKTNTSN